MVVFVFQETGRTPLMEAVKSGSVALARAILQKGVDPNTVDKTQLHAAHIAASKGLLEVRERFFRLGQYFEHYNKICITTITISG